MARQRGLPAEGIVEALGNIARTSAGTEEIDTLLETVLRECGGLIAADGFAVALHDPVEGALCFDPVYWHGDRIPAVIRREDDGWGLAGRVLREQATLLFEDLARSALQEEAVPFASGVRSWLGVPLMAAGQPIGVLLVQSEQPKAFGQEEQRLLEVLAAQTASGIELRLLRQERSRRATELGILHEIGRAMALLPTLDDLLEAIYRQVGRVLDASNFYIALYDAERDEVTFALDVSEGEITRPYSSRRAGRGLTEYIIRNRTPLLIEERVEERLAELGIQAIGRTAQSWLGVPLLSADRVVGVMAVQSYTSPGAYRKRHLDFLTTIASQAAVAIENARLLQALHQRVEDLSFLHEATQAILGAETEEELFERIREQVGRVADASNFYVALYDDAELDFVYATEGGVAVPGPGRRPVAEGGLTAYIVRQGEALLLVEQIDAWLAEKGIVGKGRPARSFLGVPMFAGEQVIGAVAIADYTRERAFTERHLGLLQHLATQAALALQRMRLRASEARKARQLAIIGEVSRKVAAILNLDELLRELARSIQLGFGYSDVAVFRVDDRANEIVLGALVGRYAGIMEWGYRQPIGEGLPGIAAETGKVVVCNDVEQEPRYVRGFDAEELTRSELCVPIIHGDRVLGVLDILSEERDAFDAEAVAAMETLAGQLAAAMRNAMLFEEREQQLASLNALSRVIQATARALTLEDLARSLCEVVLELLHVDGFFIALRTETEGRLVAPLLYDEGEYFRNLQLGSRGFTGLVLESGQPLLIRNMDLEASRYPVDRSTTVVGTGRPSASWLGVPLLRGGEVIGAISVQSYRPYAFDDPDVSFLQSVASQVVVHLERTRLFEETQRALEQVRESHERQQELLRMVQELSTPLVPVTDEILVLPLVGTVDSRRAEQIMDVLLDGVSNRHARVVILDITGVPVVDTSVANHLLQATQAVRLLGAECVLVGITPEVAQTVVGLGVDLGGLATRSDLQAGIEYALRLLGQRIVRRERGANRNAAATP